MSVLLPEIERLVGRITRTPSGCWEWTGATNGVGYGMVFVRGQRYYTHRLLYSRCVAPIPTGLVIDHLCRNTLCCNPEHLEPVTHRENIMRSPLMGAKTHCKWGHVFTPENTAITGAGARQCKACVRRRNHEGWERRQCR